MAKQVDRFDTNQCERPRKCKGDLQHHHCVQCGRWQAGEMPTNAEPNNPVYPDNQCYSCAVDKLTEVGTI